jgi:hypothetical protein
MQASLGLCWEKMPIHADFQGGLLVVWNRRISPILTSLSRLNLNFTLMVYLGCDGNIYALNDDGDVLKVDTSARTMSFIRNYASIFCGSGDPVVGPDQCICWWL